MNNFSVCLMNAVVLSVLLLQLSIEVSCQRYESSVGPETVLDREVSLFEEIKEIPFSERRDKNYNKRFVTIDGSVSIYTIEKGNGVPLILVNGGPGNSSHSFIPYFDEATKFSRVIFYDPRGVGLSDWKPGEGYSTKQVVDDLEKIRNELGIHKWVMAGWSYGGLAAQYYSLKYPQNLLGLVLIGSSYSADYSFSDNSTPDYLSKQERSRIRAVYSINGNKVVPTHSETVDLRTMQKMVYNGYLNGDWKRQFFYKPSIDEMAAVARYEWVHAKNYNRLVAADGFSVDLRGKFKNFSKPVLIFHGRHDMTFSVELPYRLRKEFKNARVVMLENSSHNPFKEEPKRFFAELKAFILEVEKRTKSANHEESCENVM